MKSNPAVLRSKFGSPVVLKSVTARGRLTGLLLTMSLRQVFRNEEDEHIEVTYTFPLPWGGVLTGLEASLGDKRMRGEVMARRQAVQKYEEAVEQGDAPVMVEKNQDGSFTASLGSLKPGEEAVIELSYAQLLSFEQGRVRLVVPTTIAPRYGDAVTQGGLPPHQAAEPDLMTEHPFGLELTVAGPLAKARLSCPSHQVSQRIAEDGVHVSLSGDAWLDRDFVFLMEGLQGQSLVVGGPDPASGDGHHALIASYCPAIALRSEASLRLKILVDCSGSMAGDSIDQARLALKALAARLNSKDRFTYSRFGTTTECILDGTPATARGLRDLEKAIQSTEANMGGTEMEAAFKQTFYLSVDGKEGDEESDVLIITDGAVWDAQNILARSRQSGHRIYALGVGSAPSESLLRELANDTGGACEFATPNEDMAAAMLRLMGRMRRASSVDTKIKLETKPRWCSPLPRRIVPDETVHVFLRLSDKPKSPPRLQVDTAHETPSEITWLPEDLVARIVAERQISHTAKAASAAEMAERYQLVTSHTNLLLVFERADAEKTNGLPSLRKVHPMFAAGSGGTGSAVRVFASAKLRPSHSAQDALVSPSVWRSARMRVEALASDSLQGIEIPAFLRREGPLTERLTAPTVKATVDRRPASPRRKEPQEISLFGRDAAYEIVRSFNQSATSGLSFRRTLRPVVERALDPEIVAAVERAGDDLESLIKAWACFLLWVHEMNSPSARLSDLALGLVEEQLQRVDELRRKSVMKMFEALPV